MRIVFFGGSFDPIHLIHQEIIDNLKKRFDKVIILPTKTSFDKVFKATDEQRLEMLNLVLLDVIIDDFELKNEKSYTIDTMNHFKKLYPNDELYFAIGSDQYDSLHLWKEIDKLKKIVKFEIFSRGNNNFINLSENEISSSTVRRGELQYVDEKIRDYIKKHRLYSTR